MSHKEAIATIRALSAAAANELHALGRSDQAGELNEIAFMGGALGRASPKVLALYHQILQTAQMVHIISVVEAEVNR